MSKTKYGIKDWPSKPAGCVFSRAVGINDCEKCPFAECINEREDQEKLADLILGGQDIEDAIMKILKDKGIK